MTVARSGGRSASRKWRRTAAPMLKGRLPRRMYSVPGGRSAAARSAAGERERTSASTRLTLGQAGRRSRRRRQSAGSTSTATTRPAARWRCSVRAPAPGPTSRTTSAGPTAASATIRARISWSLRKCWPRAFFAAIAGGPVARPGRRPAAAGRSGREDVDVGPTRGPVDFDAVRVAEVDHVAFDAATRIGGDR